MFIKNKGKEAFIVHSYKMGKRERVEKNIFFLIVILDASLQFFCFNNMFLFYSFISKQKINIKII